MGVCDECVKMQEPGTVKTDIAILNDHFRTQTFSKVDEVSWLNIKKELARMLKPLPKRKDEDA